MACLDVRKHVEKLKVGYFEPEILENLTSYCYHLNVCNHGYDTLFWVGGFMRVPFLGLFVPSHPEEYPLHQRRLLGIDAPVLERLSVVLSDGLREGCYIIWIHTI